ncbi:MAG: AIR synthase family protein [Candidatus Bathyarchaeia archaeon]|nr:AIR synthase family protein [Candidatus Bathyarchaeota archaeon]
MVGKLPPDLLAKFIFSRVGRVDPSVIIGPSLGEDAAVIDLGDGRVLVAHVDPITSAVEYIGWLAVHITSNDLAVRGVRPRWLLSVLYLPENLSINLIDKITSQMDSAAKEVDAMIVGGHSEFTPGLDRPMISMTAIGVADRNRYVTTGGAGVGDMVLMSKVAAVEGTAILSTDFRELLIKRGVPKSIIERGSGFIKRISVVKEALTLSENGLVSSMHDPTEGGLLGGLAEIAYASKKTIEVWEEKVPLAEETIIISRALGIDPLRLISSGTLIATIPWEKVKAAINALESRGIKASIIGKVIEPSESLVILHRRDGSIEEIKDVYIKDELVSSWEKWRAEIK